MLYPLTPLLGSLVDPWIRVQGSILAKVIWLSGGSLVYSPGLSQVALLRLASVRGANELLVRGHPPLPPLGWRAWLW